MLRVTLTLYLPKPGEEDGGGSLQQPCSVHSPWSCGTGHWMKAGYCTKWTIGLTQYGSFYGLRTCQAKAFIYHALKSRDSIHLIFYCISWKSKVFLGWCIRAFSCLIWETEEWSSKQITPQASIFGFSKKKPTTSFILRMHLGVYKKQTQMNQINNTGACQHQIM